MKEGQNEEYNEELKQLKKGTERTVDCRKNHGLIGGKRKRETEKEGEIEKEKEREMKTPGEVGEFENKIKMMLQNALKNSSFFEWSKEQHSEMRDGQNTQYIRDLTNLKEVWVRVKVMDQ